MDFQLKLDKFEGPFDLLLHLIEKEEVDIYDISISKIADQYLEIIDQAQKLELEFISEFLLVAATLITMKSNRLLPSIPKKEETDMDEEDKMDSGELLINQLLEYKQYKDLGNNLSILEKERGKRYSRMPFIFPPVISNPIGKHTSRDLLQAYIHSFTREKWVESTMKIRRETFSLSDCMDEIYRKCETEHRFFFSKIVVWDRDQQEHFIYTFLALLELVKLKKISCYQSQLFGDILIEKLQQEVNQVNV